MTQQIEFEGNNVEKAAMAASKKLSIPRENLKYQVLSYGSTGIFGLVGSRKAKIRVLLPKEEDETARKARESVDLPGKTDQTAQDAPTPKDSEESKDFEELKKSGEDALERITQLISEDVQISAEENRDGLIFRIKSSDAAVMIGKRGQTLEAMQYLVEKIVNKQNKERIHVQVDVEGYLKKRRASLQKLAARMAEKAAKTGKPAAIGRMSAYERKIIHIYLKDDKRVKTQSKGDGFLRKLVIFPARNSRNRQPKT